MKTKLLFLCSANIDRSPCAESLFEKSDEFEARSAGLSELAEKRVSLEDVEWADVIFVMEDLHKEILFEKFPDVKNKDVRVLGISNNFCRYDSELERLLKIKLEREGFEVKKKEKFKYSI